MATKDGRKTGGRKKGTPNKKTQAVNEMLDSLGCDPLREMAEIGMKAKEIGDMQMATACFKELAQYVAPKRKAVEMEATVDAKLDADIKNIILSGPENWTQK